MTSASCFGSAVRHTLPRSNYVCIRCQVRAPMTVRTTNPSVSLPYNSHRYASWVDTDKLRKKIWGTETPPGQEDPYGKESVFEQRRREREQKREMRKETDSVVVEPKSRNKYVEATTTKGLEIVGGPGWGKTEWNAENRHQGFMESERMEDRNAAVLAVHRALVETYALKEAGLPLLMDYYSKDPTKDYAERVAEGARFEQSMNGQMALLLESEELRHTILECVTPQERDDSAMEEMEEKETVEVEFLDEEEFPEEEFESKGAEERSLQTIKGDDDLNSESEGFEEPYLEEEPLELEEPSSDLAALVPASDTWRNVSLEDAAIKFAVLKRVMQLTGKRIPDPDISSITTPTALLVHLIKKPKPKRIAEALVDYSPVAHLPNVRIQDKRYGPIDREIEVGRWKVIKEELEKRGLPVSGRASLRNAAVRE